MKRVRLHDAQKGCTSDSGQHSLPLENNASQSEWMEREVAALGYEVIPTWTNFIAIDVRQDSREMARRLRRKGVLVRPLTVWGAPTSIRVTVGTAEQNQIFLKALQRVSS